MYASRLALVGIALGLFACGSDGDSGGKSATGGTSSGGSGNASQGGSSSGGTSSGGSSSGGTSSGGTSSGGTSSGGTSSGGTSSGGTSSGGSSGAGGGTIPTGGSVLFQENFDDANLGARGWYDGPNGSIDTQEMAPGSTSSFRCDFAVGATSCTAGKPARHKLTASETVYLSFWLKFSSNWVGSGKPYHPHMFHFINDLDGDYVGPAYSYLTTYTEVVAGKAMLALQDSKNVDLNCILRNDDTFVGCNGDFNTYAFTEDRSICSCNGLGGDLDGRDCFANGDGTWYSSRSWSSPNAFVDSAGANYKADWHFVEVYFAMNSIQNGKAVADGKIRWVQDGVTLISHDAILLRSGSHPTLAFNQFAMLPYIGDGSPIAQSFWVDDMTVATAKP
jgi:hypothetical protein